MGEVRIKIKLINAIDEGLARRGYITEREIRSGEFEAVVETGSVATVLPLEVIEQLGLKSVGKRTAEYANAFTEEVEVSEPVSITIDGRHTTEGTLILGNEILIGQTVLETLDFLVDCPNQRLIPNPKHPNQAITKVK
jgi:predicted aspartyl protease